MSLPVSAADKDLATLRVLVVDDNRDCADSTGDLLRQWGCTVGVTYQSKDVVGAAGTFEPDVILLDLGMPQLDGYECVRALFAQVGRRNTVVFAVTGYADEMHRAQALFVGFDEYLVKPVEPKELQRLLRMELALKGKKLELAAENGVQANEEGNEADGQGDGANPAHGAAGGKFR